jgi:outer membrane cobalamin receptor
MPDRRVALFFALGLVVCPGLAQQSKPCTQLPEKVREASPYVIFDRATIQGSGAASLEEFLTRRTTMNLAPAENIQDASGKTIRPLILLDGQKMANERTGSKGSPRPARLKDISLSAVERIEVLPPNAPRFPGEEATGGVINIVLRRDQLGAAIKQG